MKKSATAKNLESSSFAPSAPAASNDTPISLLAYSQEAIKHYGSYVIENRALADIRDGLKPVHRRILWAMYKLGLKSTGGFKKSARTVGEVIGIYHPHGDAAVYDALVGMTGVRPKGKTRGWLRRNINEPLIEGRGNFGDHVDFAAAQRYTECRLSTYGELLLDPDYLAVSDMVPNFSDDTVEPVILPSKLPNLLINGSEGIAVGVASYIPSFDLEAVKACAALALEGKLTSKAAQKLLSGKFSFPYGGISVDETELPGLIEDGQGAIVFSPSYQEEGSHFVITSICPRFNLAKAREQIMALKNTSAVRNETGDEGIRIVCIPTRSLSPSMYRAWTDKIKEIIQVKITFRMSATIRNSDGSVTFKNTSVLDILKSWAEFRIDLERKVLKNRIRISEKELFRLNTLLKAISNIPIIAKAMEMNGEVEVNGKTIPKSTKFLMDKLDFTEDQVEIIYETKFRSLMKMESSKIEERKKVLESGIKEMKKNYSDPIPSIVEQIKSIKL